MSRAGLPGSARPVGRPAGGVRLPVERGAVAVVRRPPAIDLRVPRAGDDDRRGRVLLLTCVQSRSDPRHRRPQPGSTHRLHGVGTPSGDVGQPMLRPDHLAVGGRVHVGVHQGVGEQGPLARELLVEVQDAVLDGQSCPPRSGARPGCTTARTGRSSAGTAHRRGGGSRSGRFAARSPRHAASRRPRAAPPRRRRTAHRAGRPWTPRCAHARGGCPDHRAGRARSPPPQRAWARRGRWQGGPCGWPSPESSRRWPPPTSGAVGRSHTVYSAGDHRQGPGQPGVGGRPIPTDTRPRSLLASPG